MLRQRIVTAVLLLAVILAAAAAGRLAFDTVLAVLVGAATFEWLRLALHPASLAVGGAVLLAAGLLGVQVFTSAPEGRALTLLMAAATLAWLLIAVRVLLGARRGARLPHPVSTLLAFFLLGSAWFAAMRLIDVGIDYLLSVLAIVWLADVAAYFAGRRWGRSKLAPAISPGKTWAGVGGAVVAVLVAVLLLAWLVPDLPLFSTMVLNRLPLAAALAVLAALVALSIAGDLFESLLKRQVGAKDSSHLLPGHGGVLDRIDASIAVLPAATLIDLWLRR